MYFATFNPLNENLRPLSWYYLLWGDPLCFILTIGYLGLVIFIIAYWMNTQSINEKYSCE